MNFKASGEYNCYLKYLAEEKKKEEEKKRLTLLAKHRKEQLDKKLVTPEKSEKTVKNKLKHGKEKK